DQPESWKARIVGRMKVDHVPWLAITCHRVGHWVREQNADRTCSCHAIAWLPDVRHWRAIGWRLNYGQNALLHGGCRCRGLRSRVITGEHCAAEPLRRAGELAERSNRKHREHDFERPSHRVGSSVPG